MRRGGQGYKKGVVVAGQGFGYGEDGLRCDGVVLNARGRGAKPLRIRREI